MPQFWTNRSVRDFAKNQDPVAAIADRARNVVFEAIQNGWGGPPFDPFALAEHLRIDVVPNQEVLEARTVSEGGKLQIQYNPNRAPNRIRFSIAHEIGHTLFDDCAQAVRNRTAYHSGEGDNWQLELLCNIAAAEILMPTGALAIAPDWSPDLHRLLELRREFAVSTEAILLRSVKLAQRTQIAFSASRLSDSPVSKFRVDYAISSNAQRASLKSGMRLSADSVLAECTAIGYTASGVESWDAVGQLKVECVGIPGFPGTTFPRVVGLAHLMSEDEPVGPTVTYVKGDATEPRGRGLRVIAQLVNDKAQSWGGGLSLSVRRKWPQAQAAFSEWAKSPEKLLKLGNVHTTSVASDIAVASLVAQSGYGESSRPRIRYGALAQALEKLAKYAKERNASVHMPRLGCNQAGASWNVVGELVFEILCKDGIAVTIYDLPNQQLPKVEQEAVLFPV